MKASSEGSVVPNYHDLFNLSSALALATQERFLKIELASGIFKKALKEAGLYVEKPVKKEEA